MSGARSYLPSSRCGPRCLGGAAFGLIGLDYPSEAAICSVERLCFTFKPVKVSPSLDPADPPVMVPHFICCSYFCCTGPDPLEAVPHSPPSVHTSAAQGLIPWWQPFLSRLQGSTSLVGATISCAGSGSPCSPDAYGGGIPHVQSHAMAMTRVSVHTLTNHLPTCEMSPNLKC